MTLYWLDKTRIINSLTWFCKHKKEKKAGKLLGAHLLLSWFSSAPSHNLPCVILSTLEFAHLKSPLGGRLRMQDRGSHVVAQQCHEDGSFLVTCCRAASSTNARTRFAQEILKSERSSPDVEFITNSSMSAIVWNYFHFGSHYFLSTYCQCNFNEIA